MKVRRGPKSAEDGSSAARARRASSESVPRRDVVSRQGSRAGTEPIQVRMQVRRGLLLPTARRSVVCLANTELMQVRMQVRRGLLLPPPPRSVVCLANTEPMQVRIQVRRGLLLPTARRSVVCLAPGQSRRSRTSRHGRALAIRRRNVATTGRN